MTKESENNEKNDLIASIRGAINPIQRRQPSYDSYMANKITNKLLLRLGLVAGLGLLGYIAIKITELLKKNRCSCD